jgi:hypothetical protein
LKVSFEDEGNLAVVSVTPLMTRVESLSLSAWQTPVRQPKWPPLPFWSYSASATQSYCPSRAPTSASLAHPFWISLWHNCFLEYTGTAPQIHAAFHNAWQNTWEETAHTPQHVTYISISVTYQIADNDLWACLNSKVQRGQLGSILDSGVDVCLDANKEQDAFNVRVLNCHVKKIPTFVIHLGNKWQPKY